MPFTPVIGLEVHIELATKSKMFCSCKAEHFMAQPNTQTCPVCLGLPGALPFPNQKAIEGTILLGLALNCQISEFSKFDRKNYFYPDLPKGYQISQYDLPLSTNGWLEVKSEILNSKSETNSKFKIQNSKRIRIRRVHLEEDTGKLIHEGGVSLIDFNRSGVPLVEIVTEPDITSAREAKLFLQKLQQLVRYLGIAEADMEKGQMRCEPNVNVKLKKDGQVFYTPITEIKNVNSFRFVEKAIDYEIKRQTEDFEKTGQQKEPGNKKTRGWDERRQVTVLQREKEEAQDYRYFPEPDIPPLRFSKFQISNLQSQIPELPEEKLTRFVKEYGLSKDYARVLIETRQRADYFEEAVRESEKLTTPQVIANWLVNKRIEIDKVSPLQLVQIILQKTQAVGLSEEEIAKVVVEVIAKNPAAAADYQEGKTQALEFLVGQVARVTGGKADPNLSRKLLLDALSAS